MLPLTPSFVKIKKSTIARTKKTAPDITEILPSFLYVYFFNSIKIGINKILL